MTAKAQAPMPSEPQWARERRAAQLLGGLRRRGISVRVSDSGGIGYSGPKGALSTDDKRQLGELKTHVLEFLAAEAELNSKPRRSYVLRGDEWVENDNGVGSDEVLSHLFSKWQQQRAQERAEADKRRQPRPTPRTLKQAPEAPLRRVQRPSRPKPRPRVCRHCGTNFDQGKDLRNGTSGSLPRGWDVHIDPAQRSMFCTCGPKCRAALGLKEYR